MKFHRGWRSFVHVRCCLFGDLFARELKVGVGLHVLVVSHELIIRQFVSIYNSYPCYGSVRHTSMYHVCDCLFVTVQRNNVRLPPVSRSVSRLGCGCVEHLPTSGNYLRSARDICELLKNRDDHVIETQWTVYTTQTTTGVCLCSRNQQQTLQSKIWTQKEQLLMRTDKKLHELSRRDRATRYISWNLVNCCTARRKITLEKAYKRLMTLEVTEGHGNCRYLIVHISLPISGLW